MWRELCRLYDLIGSSVVHITESGYEELIMCTAAAGFTYQWIHGSKPTICILQVHPWERTCTSFE
jgi:hypothetical protein